LDVHQAEDTSKTADSSSSIRWLRVLGAAFAVIALSFLILMVMTTIYAMVLAFQARGAPDQIAINRFAASISPKWMPWLEMLLTLVMAFRVARRSQKARIVHGLFIGVLAALLSLAVTLAFGGRLGLRSLLFFLIVVALGWLGGFVGQKMTVHNPTRIF
jgi:uncharacterized membrane protein